MSKYQSYIRYLEDLSDFIYKVIYRVEEEKRKKFGLYKVFIRELTKAISGELTIQDFLCGKDVFTNMRKSAIDIHDKRLSNRPGYVCCNCGSKHRNGFPMVIDSYNNVFCSEICAERYHGVKKLDSSSKLLYDLLAKKSSTHKEYE